MLSVSSTYMRRHMKQYHCPRGKFYEAAPVPKRMVEQIKCEYCGKNVARSYHARHIQDVHQKKCKWCRKTFSFIQSRDDHELICRIKSSVQSTTRNQKLQYRDICIKMFLRMSSLLKLLGVQIVTDLNLNITIWKYFLIQGG